MVKNRLEAFSDGVLAIVITIMVLEMKVPHDASWPAVAKLMPVFLSYVLSFVYVGIYWNNHHHMVHTVERTTGAMLWANLHLLFWLSLMPFATGWVGENGFAAAPTTLYGIVLLMAAIAYFILQTVIVRHQGPESKLVRAIGRDVKGKASVVLYSVAIAFSFFYHPVSLAIYVGVALMWIVPDRRIERLQTD